MIIVGAMGFAKEVLEIAAQANQSEGLAFYDDVNADVPDYLFGKFPVLKSIEAAKEYFNTDNRFTIGIGNPYLRKLLYEKFTAIGGTFVSTISADAHIGSFEVEIGIGTNILAGATISNQTLIGMGCLIYYKAIITHDCKIGNFAEISPAAVILGRCSVGSYSQIGANATILPDITIGENVIVGAGAVVTKNVPDNAVVYGVPAKLIREVKSIPNQ